SSLLDMKTQAKTARAPTPRVWRPSRSTAPRGPACEMASSLFPKTTRVKREDTGAPLKPAPRYGRPQGLSSSCAYVNYFTTERASTLVGVLERCLRPVLDAQLREQMLHVELHRVVGETEALGDLRVGESVRDQRPHLPLPRRELARRAPPAPRATVDPASRSLREDQLTRVHLPDRRERLLRRLGLQREPLGAGVERPAY